MWPRPGSAAASAAQLDSLLTRLAELEEYSGAQQANEDQLKEVNQALMQRLTEYRQANEDNVVRAEEEFARMQAELVESRKAHEAAESRALASEASLGRAGDASQQLQYEMSAKAHAARVEALGAASQLRKYLLLLRRRAARQRALRALQGSRLAGPLLSSVRRATLRGPFAAWARELAVRAVAERVARAEAARWLRRCMGRLRLWRAAGRRGRRAAGTRSVLSQLSAFRALRLAVQESAAERRDVAERCSRRDRALGVLSSGAISTERPEEGVRRAFDRWALHRQSRRRAARLEARMLAGAALSLGTRALARWHLGALSRHKWRVLMGRAEGMRVRLRLSLSLCRWRTTARRTRGTRRRHTRAFAITCRRIEAKCWRAWWLAVRLGRERRAERYRAFFVRWCAEAKAWRRAAADLRAARLHWKRRGSGAARGMGALKDRLRRKATARLGAAAARVQLKKASRRHVAAALLRWTAGCARRSMDRRIRAETELSIRSELLAQARASSGALEDEDDELRARLASMDADMEALQVRRDRRCASYLGEVD